MIPYLVQTFARLAQDGLGPRRRKIVLEEVSRLNLQTESEFLIHERSSGTISPVPPVEFDLSPAPQPATRLLVRFLTPTELKAGAQILALPDFGALAARARDRISTLRSAYDEGPLQIDFRAFTESASAVKMTRCEITSVSRERFSSRTGLVHPIGGFVGEAEYEGSLSDFVPYLKLAKWTGVGRQTVWGKGEIEVEVLE